MKRRDLSSVFMTNGRADTPWHSVLESCRFRVPAFDQRQYDLCGYCHLYVINMTWIFKSRSLFPAVVLALGVCLLLRRSIGIRRSRKTLVTHIVLLPNYQEDEATLRETPDDLVHSPSADILLATDTFENRNTQDKGSCLQRNKATYHPPGIPDQWAFRQLWKKYGVELHQQCVHDSRRC